MDEYVIMDAGGRRGLLAFGHGGPIVKLRETPTPLHIVRVQAGKISRDKFNAR
jgi:hypothetical protein